MHAQECLHPKEHKASSSALYCLWLRTAAKRPPKAHSGQRESSGRLLLVIISVLSREAPARAVSLRQEKLDSSTAGQGTEEPLPQEGSAMPSPSHCLLFLRQVVLIILLPQPPEYLREGSSEPQNGQRPLTFQLQSAELSAWPTERECSLLSNVLL